MRLRSVLYLFVVTSVAVTLAACSANRGGDSPPSEAVVLSDPEKYKQPSGSPRDGDIKQGSASKNRDLNQPQHITSGMDTKNTHLNRYTGQGIKIGIWEPGVYINDDAEFQDDDGNTRMGTGVGMDGKDFNGFSKNNMPDMQYCKQKGYEDKKISDSFWGRYCPSGYTADRNEGEHALSVASTAAGTKFGIANQATIIPYQVGNFAGAVSYNQDGRTNPRPAMKYADAYQHAIDNKLIAVNNSYHSIDASDTSYAVIYTDCMQTKTRELCDIAQKSIVSSRSLVTKIEGFYDELYETSDHKSKNNPIMVYATGNDGKDEASIEVRAGYYRPKVAQWLIGVAAIDKDGREAYFSNRCGVAKYYCMTALGTGVKARSRSFPSGNLTDDDNRQGTSFSTPLVTGSFALISEKFSTISVQEIRYRLLYTARHKLKDGTALTDRIGNPVTPTIEDDCISPTGCSNHFGNGALRLDLAMKPVGQSKSAYNGKSLLSAQRQPIKNTKLEASGAFGSGIKHAFNDKVTTVYDALDAPFQYRMSRFVSGGQHNNTHSALTLASQDRPVHTTKIVNTSGLAYTTDRHDTATQMGFVAANHNGVNSILGKHLNYRANVGTMNFITAVEPNDGTLMYGVERMFSYNKTTITPLTKIIYEQNKVLGAKGSATLATTGASTSTFIGMKAQTHIKGIDIYTYAHYGITRTRGDFGVSLQNLNNIESNDFGLSFSKGFETPRNNGKFGVAYSMPLRVTRADATLHYNSGRDKDKNLSYKTEQVDITPNGKARMIEAFYQTDSKHKPHSLRLHIVHNRDIDHTRGVNATSVGAYYKIKFNSDTILKNRTP